MPLGTAAKSLLACLPDLQLDGSSSVLQWHEHNAPASREISFSSHPHDSLGALVLGLWKDTHGPVSIGPTRNVTSDAGSLQSICRGLLYDSLINTGTLRKVSIALQSPSVVTTFPFSSPLLYHNEKLSFAVHGFVRFGAGSSPWRGSRHRDGSGGIYVAARPHLGGCIRQ